CVQYKSYAFSF
nr:immunoglobulin light chain junction region [Macaca mulatta]